MKLVFCGTPEFAVPTLQALLVAGHEIALVLTQPDRPAGRKMEPQAPAVKRFALERDLPVAQPERLRHNLELRAQLLAIAPEAIAVVAYGRLIPTWMLELPRLGNINVHGSLLPKYRGAAPIQWAVANGETITGVSTMRLDAGLDTGDVLLEQPVPIGPTTMATELFAELASVGAELMRATLAGMKAGTIRPRAQDHAAATLAPILTRDDGLMRLGERTAREAFNRWRGFTPWPGAFAAFRGKRFLVHGMRIAEAAEVPAQLAPGEMWLGDGALLAGAAEGTALQLDEVQMEGKPRMAGAQFARDFQLRRGERLD